MHNDLQEKLETYYPHITQRFLDEPYWIAAGIYYGYPQCCIEDFVDSHIKKARQVELVSTGTGYMPCDCCVDKVLNNWQGCLQEIEERRSCKESFPLEEDISQMDKFFIVLTQALGHDVPETIKGLSNNKNLSKIWKKMQASQQASYHHVEHQASTPNIPHHTPSHHHTNEESTIKILDTILNTVAKIKSIRKTKNPQSLPEKSINFSTQKLPKDTLSTPFEPDFEKVEKYYGNLLSEFKGNIPAYIASGIYYGFPECCIKDMSNGNITNSYEDKNISSYQTGYMPCDCCYYKVIDDWPSVVADINERRSCTKEFLVKKSMLEESRSFSMALHSYIENRLDSVQQEDTCKNSKHYAKIGKKL